MRNVWRAVEQIVNTVPAECSHNREPILLCVVFNDLSKVSVSHTGFSYINSYSVYTRCILEAQVFPHTHLNGHLQTFTSSINQLAALFVNIANEIRFVQVSVVSVQVAGHIEIDNIAILQWSLIWDTVTNDFVDRCTARLGEVVIVQWRWICSTFYGCIVNDSV